MTLAEILQRLHDGDESVDIEAKAGSTPGKSLLETVSAFSNEPGLGGGYIVCGVTLRPGALFYDYEVVGVPNVAKWEQDFAALCRDAFNVPLRPMIRVERHPSSAKDAVIIHVPEVVPTQKPVYVKSRGLPGGAFRRVSTSDTPCTDDDIALLYGGRGQHSYDETAEPSADLSDLSPEALNEYRRLRREQKADAIELTYSDSDLLFTLGATTRHNGRLVPTVAGLVLFGTEVASRRFYPMLRVDYILVEGREWVRDPAERFQTVEMRGALLPLISRVVGQILGDIPSAFSLAPDGIHRRDIPRLPREVIREAVVNALIHRSYRQRDPIQIIRYTNRLEIRNPGFSLKADDKLGAPGSVIRNEKIAAVVHEAGPAETKGSGIATMQREMKTAGLIPPLFESDRGADQFTATFLLHHFLNESDTAWLATLGDCQLDDEDARYLVTVRETGAISNAIARSLTGRDTLFTSRRLQRLREMGLLEQRGSGVATYYIAGTRLLRAWDDSVHSGLSTDPNSPDSALPVNLHSPDSALPVESVSLPDTATAPLYLQSMLRDLKGRTPPAQMKHLLLALCAWNDLSLPQLARLTRRNPTHLSDKHLRPLLRSDEVVFVYPNEPNHPQQAYRTAQPGEKDATKKADENLSR